MERNPIRNDARRRRRLDRLNGATHCSICGCGDWETLLPGRRSLLESHHVLGEAVDPQLVDALCRNCHAIETERQLKTGLELRRLPNRTTLEVIVYGLEALALFLAALADRAWRWARQGRGLVDKLDADVPQWRSWPIVQT